MAMAYNCSPMKTTLLSGSRSQNFIPPNKRKFRGNYSQQTTLLGAGVVTSRRQRASFSRLLVVSQANDLIRVVATVFKTARDGLESGTNLVPDSLPRPAARGIVAVVGLLAIFYVFNSLVSIVSFVLGIGGLAYVAYIYFNKDKDSSPSAGGGVAGGDSTQKSLEEARRIMEKYK